LSNGKTLCLNMIVKNEMANLERCLTAVAPHIDCWVIGDTGSSDDTQDFVMSFFAARGLPGELHSFPFENFEQARNAALDYAYAAPLGYDYLLFCDADMELVVDDADFRHRLSAPGYRLIQRTVGSLTYWNVRLARRDAAARYYGVTHEYLDVPGGAEQLHDIWYRDHASGANRTDKFERDIKLLSTALEQEPGNHRYWFYLAQSYKDCGRTAEAAATYAKRAEMGGWEEEAWYAQMMRARCLRDLGDEAGFLRETLAAFNRRPSRSEPLYDLAKYYRERGMNEAGVLFSEAGLALSRPDEDVLFLEDFVYTAGLKEEFSIAANYSKNPVRKDRGFAACNWLALNRDIPARARDLARWNLFFYLEPASAMMPSFAANPAQMDERASGECRLTDWLAPDPAQDGPHEKNWVPQVTEDKLLFVCRWDPIHVVDDAAAARGVTMPKIAADQFSGGSQALAFDNGWLALIDEVSERDGRRYCQHRFVWLSASNVLSRVSRPFFFNEKGSEFVAGLSWHPDGMRLLISYGVDDAEAWIATVKADEVRTVLDDVDRLPSGEGESGTAPVAASRGKLKFLPNDLEKQVRPFRIPTPARERASPFAAVTETAWVPEAPAAGTELMVAGLRERMGKELERIDLRINHPGQDGADNRPRVVWIHHDVNQAWVQWCKDKALVDLVSCFVFVSHWQRERYLASFGLAPERCVVLPNATEVSPDPRCWEAAPIWRCAYTSTPFRGLSVLLDVWERLGAANAELHIWSSMKLYLENDDPYRSLFERAKLMPSVTYHGIVPNVELRAALRDMHFLVYPSTFAETSCLAVIEAMAAGCRVIVPSLGALSETTAGYARVYAWNPDPDGHADVFANALESELATPWAGEPGLSLAQQEHCAAVYDWPRRLVQWRQLIGSLCSRDKAPGNRAQKLEGRCGS
jgi:glycosyltransferase involved in cell wall biosynthesis